MYSQQNRSKKINAQVLHIILEFSLLYVVIPATTTFNYLHLINSYVIIMSA